MNQKKKEKNHGSEEEKLPAEAQDAVARFKQNHRGGKLKQVLVVDDPASINDKLSGPTGLTQNGGKVYCLRFSDSGADLGDKVVMIQGEKVVENSNFDDDMTELMNDKTAAGVRDLEDNDSKLIYTDENGISKEIDLITQPRDLTLKDKELLSVQMMEIEQKIEEKIKEADALQSEIQEVAETVEQYGNETDPEIIANVVEPANSKLSKLQVSIEGVYGEIRSLNKSRVDLLKSKGLDKIVPEIDETGEKEDEEPEAFEVPGKRVR